MNRKQFIVIAFLTLSWACFTPISFNPTYAASTAETMPLTQLEQTSRVYGLANRAMRQSLFPQSIKSAPYFQRDYKIDWMNASIPEKIDLAEKIGNQGRARFAFEHGLEKFIGSKGGIPQGPDSVYWDPQNGNILVLEAKGGLSPLKMSYESRQGTNLNSILSAEYRLSSENAIPKARLADAIVIKAAQQDRLSTAVIRTEHEEGSPLLPEQEGDLDNQNVADEAANIEQRLTVENPELASTFSKATEIVNTHMLQYQTFVESRGVTTYENVATGLNSSKMGLQSIENDMADINYAQDNEVAGSTVVAILGFAGSAMIGWEAYQQSREAWAMWNDPSLRSTALPYLQTVSATGSWGESGTLFMGTASQVGMLGEGSLSTVGTGAGECFLPVAIGAEAINVGYAYYKYSHGMMSQRGFNRHLIGSGTFITFTGIGAGIGFFVGGVGAVPGAAAGAAIGSVAQVIEEIRWYSVDKQFDEQQWTAVDRVVNRHYGLAQ